ncbi:AaceriADR321Cp [[Ashbya] aceris (nom. inval.)]|nr:AaceriADR321Cp [[Ashbya] aceris (nom. inval.)]
MVDQLVYYGVVVAVVSSGMQSFGLVLQRKAALQVARGTVQVVYRSRLWQMGLTLFILANVFGSTMQIATLPLVMLAPLQACGLLFNSWFSCWLLAEPFCMHACVGTVLICGGGVLLGTVGTRMGLATGDALRHDYGQLLQLVSRSRFLWFFGASNVLAASLVAYAYYRLRQSHSWGILRHLDSRWPQTDGLLLALASGIWSAHSLLCAKCIADILLHAADEAFVFSLLARRLLPVLCCFLTFALLQLYLLNQALQYVSTSVLYPFVFSVYNSVTILNGAIFYEQESMLTTVYVFGMLLGLLSLSAGISLLANIADTEPLSKHSSPPFSTFLARDAVSSPAAWQDGSAPDEYVSLPRRPQGFIDAGRNLRKLSFEQEGLLQQLV